MVDKSLSGLFEDFEKILSEGEGKGKGSGIREYVKELLVSVEGKGVSVSWVDLKVSEKFGRRKRRMYILNVLKELWEDVVFEYGGSYYRVDRVRFNGKWVYGVRKVDKVDWEKVREERKSRYKVVNGVVELS